MLKKALVMHATMTDFRLDDDDPEIGPLMNVGDNRYSAAVTVHGEATYTLAYGPGLEPEPNLEISQQQQIYANELRALADRVERGDIEVEALESYPLNSEHLRIATALIEPGAEYPAYGYHVITRKGPNYGKETDG